MPQCVQGQRKSANDTSRKWLVCKTLHPYKKLGVVVHACNPNAGELESGGYLGFTNQPD